MLTKTPLGRISLRDASDMIHVQLAAIAVIAAVRATPPSPVRAPPPPPVRAPPPSSILLQLPFGEDEELFSAAAWNDAHRCTLARLGYEVRSSPDLRGGIKSTSARVAVSTWIAGLRVVLLYKVHGPFVEVMDVEGASTTSPRATAVRSHASPLTLSASWDRPRALHATCRRTWSTLRPRRRHGTSRGGSSLRPVA